VVSTVWRNSWRNPTLYEPLSDEIYWFKVMSDLGDYKNEVQRGRTKYQWLPEGFDANNLSPLGDIIYYWDVAYSCPDRESQGVKFKTASLSSPVAITLVRGLYCITWYEELTLEYEGEYPPADPYGRNMGPHEVLIGTWIYKTKSTLMQT
jgi:hypothetical protein